MYPPSLKTSDDNVLAYQTLRKRGCPRKLALVTISSFILPELLPKKEVQVRRNQVDRRTQEAPSPAGQAQSHYHAAWVGYMRTYLSILNYYNSEVSTELPIENPDYGTRDTGRADLQENRIPHVPAATSGGCEDREQLVSPKAEQPEIRVQFNQVALKQDECHQESQDRVRRSQQLLQAVRVQEPKIR